MALRIDRVPGWLLLVGHTAMTLKYDVLILVCGSAAAVAAPLAALGLLWLQGGFP